MGKWIRVLLAAGLHKGAYEQPDFSQRILATEKSVGQFEGQRTAVANALVVDLAKTLEHAIPLAGLRRGLASIMEHAIACGTGQQFARGRAGRFRTTRWSVVLLSAQNAAEARLGP